jgi:hypothetical protein
VLRGIFQGPNGEGRWWERDRWYGSGQATGARTRLANMLHFAWVVGRRRVIGREGANCTLARQVHHNRAGKED